MTSDINCDFGTSIDTINNMTDAETKEYFEDLEADYWIDECKNIF